MAAQIPTGWRWDPDKYLEWDQIFMDYKGLYSRRRYYLLRCVNDSGGTSPQQLYSSDH